MRFIALYKMMISSLENVSRIVPTDEFGSRINFPLFFDIGLELVEKNILVVRVCLDTFLSPG